MNQITAYVPVHSCVRLPNNVVKIDQSTQSELTEQKLIRLDGQVIDVEVTGIPTTYQDKPAVQIIIRDVTERNKAEAERRSLEE